MKHVWSLFAFGPHLKSCNEVQRLAWNTLKDLIAALTDIDRPWQITQTSMLLGHALPPLEPEAGKISVLDLDWQALKNSRLLHAYAQLDPLIAEKQGRKQNSPDQLQNSFNYQTQSKVKVKVWIINYSTRPNKQMAPNTCAMTELLIYALYVLYIYIYILCKTSHAAPKQAQNL